MAEYRIHRREIQENLEWRVIKPMWDAVDIYDTLQTLTNGLNSATPGQRAIFATTWLDSEVCNGGFDQFFYNSTGILTNEALLGFDRLMAIAHAELLGQAIGLFPEGQVPSNRGERVELLETVVQKNDLDKLDHLYYKLDKQKPLCEFMLEYIAERPEEFFIE